MTIDEAIEIITLYLQHSEQWGHHNLDDALQLGVEALKRIKESRLLSCQVASEKLPGETEE